MSLIPQKPPFRELIYAWFLNWDQSNFREIRLSEGGWVICCELPKSEVGWYQQTCKDKSIGYTDQSYSRGQTYNPGVLPTIICPNDLLADSSSVI